ncbi:MAG: flippase-like domain-containing protein [Chloroflexi bacterium]|nr:flippase-like domain-containing protein [Chloroflexota bacterium]
MEEAGSAPATAEPAVPRADASAKKSLFRRLLPWLLRSLGLLILVALSFLGVDIIGGLKLMGDAQPGLLVAALVVFSLGLLVKMVAWVGLAQTLKLGYQKVRSYVKLFLIGWSAGLGLPRGAAPLARVAILAADKRSVPRGVIVDVADRLIELVTMVFLLLVSAAYLSAESTRVLQGVGLGLAAATAALLVLGAVAWLGRPLLRRLLSYRWIKALVDDVTAAVDDLRRTPRSVLAWLVLLNLVASLLTVASVLLVSRSLDIDLSYPALIAAFAAIRLTTLLPISINGLGPREGILTAAVAGAGFSSEAGVALGLLWFLIQAVTRLAGSAAWFMSSVEGVETTQARKAEAKSG